MPLGPTIFEQIFDNWSWKEIRNCPGRFIFAKGRSRLTAEEITGIEIKADKFQSEKVGDEILVAKFDTGGGLISYRTCLQLFQAILLRINRIAHIPIFASLGSPPPFAILPQHRGID